MSVTDELKIESKEQSIRAEVERLRAANDSEGLARLILNGGVSKQLRKTFNLTKSEWNAMHHEKLKQSIARDEAQRLKQLEAYDELCKARERGDLVNQIFRNKTCRAVVIGKNLYSEVPRFKLTKDEFETLSRKDQRLGEAITEAAWHEMVLKLREGPADFWPVWKRVAAGHYMSQDGWWEIKRLWGEWLIYHEDELFGPFEGAPWPYNDGPPEYQSFQSLTDAMAFVHEARDAGYGSNDYLERLERDEEQNIEHVGEDIEEQTGHEVLVDYR